MTQNVHREAILDYSHPDTLRARNAVALTCLRSGRPDEAGRILSELLEECYRSLGDSHVDTQVVAGNLAVCRFRVQPDEASLQLLESQVRDRARLFGSAHPMTLTAAESTATALRECGRTDEAYEIAVEVVAARIRRLGHLHPDSLVSRLGLALIHIDLNELYVATGDLLSIDDDTLLADRTSRMIGLTAVGHLAWCYSWLGRPVLARQVARRAAAESTFLFGAPQPLTAGLV